MPPRHLRLALSGALFAFGLVSTVADAATPVVGEKWRMTSSSSMGMPGQTMEMCLPKRASTTQGPPTPPQQKSCTVSNMQHSGTKQTMHMRCDTNGQVMEGDMESESLGPDHYRTTMHMTMSMGKFDMVSEYQKLEGSCDASAPITPTAALPPGALGQAASGETPPWAKPGAMDAARAQAKERADAEAAQAPKEESKDKLKSKLKGLIGF